MLRIIIQVNTPMRNAQAVKEDFAMYLERYGDARVVSVEQQPQVRMEQLTIDLLRK